MTQEIDEGMVSIVMEIADKNQSGLEALEEEEIAEKRRNESRFSAAWRKGRKKLGMRKSGAQKIEIK